MLLKLTLFKEDLLDKHPGLFAQFVWKNRQAEVTLHGKAGAFYMVTGHGTFGFVLLPETALRESELTKIKGITHGS